MIILPSWFYTIRDLFVPWVRPLAAQDSTPPAHFGAQLASDQLEDAVTSLTAMFDADEDRRGSVDTRLSTMVGLSSIAATVVTGVVVAQIVGTVKIGNAGARWSVTVLAFYLCVQLWDCVHWAIRGLQRRHYWGDTVDDVLPRPSESTEQHRRRRIAELQDQIDDNCRTTNDKVTAMAIAHRAATNFMGALLLLSALGAGFVLFGPAPPVEPARLMIEGPAGPSGPKGDAGPMGPRGEQGPPGPPGASALAKKPKKPNSAY